MLELIYRKRSHISMFIDGGICFYIIDLLCNRFKKAKQMSLYTRGLLGSAVITGIEFITGIIVNKKLKLKIWDYSKLPLNLSGQICLGYSLLWYILSLPVIAAGNLLIKKAAGKI
ncbi:MAG: hypothetical protein PHW77_00555 [Eubacteriales bacterium]|nr:hypothetical protein [Eubacteriales bacterium]